MTPGQKKLIISFHDLHPGSWECCRRFIDRARKLGAQNMTLLVIPQYHGDPVFSKNNGFVEWLQSLPAKEFDLCLHGYTHQAEQVSGHWIQRLMGNVYTTGEGEFYQLSQEEAKSKLTAGLKLFVSQKLPVYGFTAPAWLLSEEAKQAVRDVGFLYNTLWNGVELPASNIFIKAPSLVYSSRNAWRRFASKVWVSTYQFLSKNKHFVRLAAHPIDFQYPDIENHLYQVLEKALRSRSTITYRDLVPPHELRPVTLAS